MPTALFLVDCQTEEALIGDPAYNAGTKDASSLYLKAKRSYLRDPHTPLNGQGLLPTEVLRRFHLELYRTATSAVRELSFQATTNQVLSGPKGKLFELSLTQDEFRELTAPLHKTLAHAVTDTLAGRDP